jgi:hypothetical protein
MSLTLPDYKIEVEGSEIEKNEILDLNLHFGCTTEVSSFEIVIDNGNTAYNAGDYYVGGTKEIQTGDDIVIYVKRGTINGTKPLLTGKVEDVDIVDQNEDYEFRNVVTIRGRCLGSQFFDRKYSGDLNETVGSDYRAYQRKEGEAESLVAYLIDNYTSLSHIRTTDLMAAPANSGQKNVTVTDGTKFTAGRLVKIYDEGNWEYNRIDSIAGNVLTMYNNLVNNYTTGDNGAVGLDLIWVSNTTFTEMLFDEEIIYDILKYIADVTSGLDSVIGYDIRVEYDGKFAFIERGTLTEPYSPLTGECQVERYRANSVQVRNRIKIEGKADKPYPVQNDGQAWSDVWTETVVCDRDQVASDITAGDNHVHTLNGAAHFEAGDFITIISAEDYATKCGEVHEVDHLTGNDVYITDTFAKDYDASSGLGECIIAQVWTYGGWGYVPFSQWDINVIAYETVSPIYEGVKSIKVAYNDVLTPTIVLLTLKDPLDLRKYTELSSRFYFGTTAPDWLVIEFIDEEGGRAVSGSRISGWDPDTWKELNASIGTQNSNSWTLTGGFNWNNVRVILFYISFAAANSDSFYIDRFFVRGLRWGGGSDNDAVDGFAEDDSVSQPRYGIKEYSTKLDMLLSDAECEAKAQALLAFYKGERVTIELSTETLDWGDEPFAPGNLVGIDFAKIGPNDSFRIDAIDLTVSSLDHRCLLTFTINNFPARLADYLYRLSRKIRMLEKNYSAIR